jgi:hypothetical protein
MAVGDDASDGEADAEGDEWRRGVVDVTRWRSVNDGRIVGRDVYHLGIGWSDLDDCISDENNLSFIGPFDNRVGDNDHLLGCALQRSEGLRLLPKRLDGIHEFQRLFDKGLAEINGPG